MKKMLLTVLAALTGLGSARAADTATLFASNLGSGLTAQGGSPAVSTGTIRFGTFPTGFDFAANAENFAALDAAFTQVHAVSGPISTLSTPGFFDIEHEFATNVSYEGTAYDSSASSTSDVAGDIAGEKIYIWVLNNTTASAATQQAVFSSNAVWPDKDLLVTDVTVSTDVGTAGLTAHLGVISGGIDIGAGAPSHSLGGATEVPSAVVATRAPSATFTLVGSSVTFSYTAAGTAPFTQQWFKTGNATALGSGSTYTIPSAQLTDDGTYYVVVTNGAGSETSNTVELDVITAVPTVEDQPDAVAYTTGANVTFSVVAKGAGTLSYRWLKGTAAVPGGTQPTLQLYGISLADAGLYRCEISNVVAGKVNKVLSNQALLTVVQDNIPVARVVARESTTGSVTLTLNYAETGVLPANKATLQWKKDGVAIAGQTSKTLRITPLATSPAPVLYTCEVQAVGIPGPIVGASTELIVVNQAPLITNPTTLNMPDGQVGEPYSYQVPVNSTLTRAGTFAATGLPLGLTINRTTGLITGRPQTATATGRPARVTITVSNGVLPNAVATDEIVITTIAPNLAGTWVGPVERGALSQGLGGRIDMTIAPTGVLSGSLTLGTTVHRFAGGYEFDSLNSVHEVSFSIRRAITQTPLQVSFSIAGNEITEGEISDGTETIGFEGWRNIWTRTSTAAAYAANYNALLDLADSEDIGDLTIPQGYSFATFRAAAAGTVTISGKLSDDTSITGSTFIGPNGQVLLFQTLYTTALKGSLLGLAVLDTEGTSAVTTDNTLSGDADWNRPANLVNNLVYAAGFGPVNLSISGGAYTAPATGRVLLGLTPGTNNAEVEVTGANLESPLTNADDILETASIAAASKITVANTNELGISLTGVTATGALNGTLKPYTKSEKIQGLVVPVDGVLSAVGFFLTDEAATASTRRLSGSIELMPAPAAP